MRRGLLYSSLLAIVSLVVAACLYSRLPDPVPVHWDFAGHANGWMAKPLGAFMLPLLQLGVVLLLAIAPVISPRRFSIDRFARSYAKMLITISAFLTAVAIVALTEAAGLRIIGMNRFVFVGIGALFVVIGNYLGKVTPNFFVGVRTPWTLASREVWSRTHRLSSWIFVGGGAVLAMSGLIHPSLSLMIAVVVVVCVVPIVYSYVVHLQVGDEDDASDDE